MEYVHVQINVICNGTRRPAAIAAIAFRDWICGLVLGVLLFLQSKNIYVD